MHASARTHTQTHAHTHRRFQPPEQVNADAIRVKLSVSSWLTMINFLNEASRDSQSLR